MMGVAVKLPVKLALSLQCRSSQQEEPEALLDLILECQGQRLEDQRASLSLLPDPEPDWFCGSCSPDQAGLPTLDFYCRLIQYQVIVRLRPRPLHLYTWQQLAVGWVETSAVCIYNLVANGSNRGRIITE